MQKRTGNLLVEKGLLTDQQLQQSVAFAQKKGLRLGEAAVELGFINKKQLQSVFGNQNRFNFFYIETEFFPAITHDIFDIETILRYGVLPLGFKTEYRFLRKTKRLNLGFLNPDRCEQLLPELQKLLKLTETTGIINEFKIYLIIAEQFLDVVDKKYNFPEAKVRSLGTKVDEAVLLYLDSGLNAGAAP